MKKSIIASILGIAVATVVSSAYGQGTTLEDNYNSSPYMPVTYSSTAANLPAALASSAGNGVGDANVDVELLFALGANQSLGSLVALPSSIEAIDPSKSALGQPGYFDTLSVVIPGYTSGSVTFAIEAFYVGTLYGNTGTDYAHSNLRGVSATWNESSLATGLATATTWAGLPGPNGSSLVALANVAPVPEPTTLALGGLGLASLMAFRRKQSKQS